MTRNRIKPVSGNSVVFQRPVFVSILPNIKGFLKLGVIESKLRILPGYFYQTNLVIVSPPVPTSLGTLSQVIPMLDDKLEVRGPKIKMRKMIRYKSCENFSTTRST